MIFVTVQKWSYKKLLKEFKIPEDLLSRMHFKECEFKKFNILYGGNGSGKSTLLDAIDKELKDKEDYIVHSYRNSKDNERLNNPSPYSTRNYTRGLSRKCNALYMSEGQSIMYSFVDWYYSIDTSDNNKHYIVILDEIDSGLSCDHVNVILHVIKDLLEKNNVQIFIASNMYHWVYVHNEVFSLYDGKFIKIESYEEYFKTQMDKQPIVGEKSDFNFL